MSIREGNLGYIQRTIKPALGFTQVRKVRGPLLDTLYARLMRCGNLACTGKPFTEHRNIPDLRPDPADPRLEWEQAADRGTRTGRHTGSLTRQTRPGWSSTSRAAGTTPRASSLAGGFDLRNTAARLGHSGGGATTLRHYADPVPEVDRRAAAYLAQLTARPSPPSPKP